jgi:hypothetical protein
MPTATVAFRRPALCILLGALSTLFAVLLLQAPGMDDIPLFFVGWIATILRFGVVGGYARNATVQMPLYAVIFWLVGRCAELLQVPIVAAYKASLLVAWLATGVCLRRWTSDAVLIWAMLLALLPNVALGYFDIYHAPPLLIALWAAREERWAAFSTAFAIFLSIKAQALILAPFAVVYAVAIARRERWSVSVVARLLLPAAAIAASMALLFGREIELSFRRAMDNIFLSGNALNACWLITHWVRAFHPGWYGPLQPDGSATYIMFWSPNAAFLPRSAMRAAFLASYALLLAVSWRRARTFQGFVFSMFVGFLAYFALNAGVHENHLFYAALLSLVLYLTDRRYALHALVCCLAANANLILFYGLTGKEPSFSRVVGIDLALPFAVLNVAFFLVCAWELLTGTDAADLRRA